jgi:WD40 repeat protein
MSQAEGRRLKRAVPISLLIVVILLLLTQSTKSSVGKTQLTPTMMSANDGKLSTSSFLYGVDSHNDGLTIIDPDTGYVTLIGPLDPDPDRFVTPVSMAIRPSDLVIFVLNNSTNELVTVNRCTGRTMSTVTLERYGGELAFTPDGTLYWVGNTLYKVDIDSGALTSIGNTGLPFNIYGADASPDGIIYGVEATLEDRQRLASIDPGTGVGTIVATLSADIGMIGSVVFSPEGKLIGSGFQGPYGDILFDINPSNGLVTNIRNVTPTELGVPQGMGFAPPCASIFLPLIVR